MEAAAIRAEEVTRAEAAEADATDLPPLHPERRCAAALNTYITLTKL